MGLCESMVGRGLFLGIPVYSPEGVNLSPFTAENIGAVGVDICDVARIQEAIERRPLYTKLTFTPKEIAYCDRASGDLRAQRYATRFAAKEAVAKALGGMPYRYTDIGVVNEENGKPQVELRGKAKEYSERIGVRTIHLSLAHIRETAIAFSIAIRQTSS